MGVEFGLYEVRSKQFIWLGKKLYHNQGFQIADAKIAAFLSELCLNDDVELRLFNDMGSPPDWHDSSWVRVANWCDEPEGDD